MEGEYAQDPEDKTSVSTVQQIRIADFINNVVAQRRSQYMSLSLVFWLDKSYLLITAIVCVEN